MDVFIPAFWGPRVNDFAKEAQKFSLFFIDRSDRLANGGNIVYTPNITEMSSNTKSAATAVTLNSPTETAVTLTVNTWNEVSFAIEDREAAIVAKDFYLQEKLVKNAVYTALQTLENAIVDLFASLNNTVGASTTACQESDIRKAIGIIEAATKEETADNPNFMFVYDTKVYWNQIAGNTTFQIHINTPAADPIGKGRARSLYGVSLYLSNLIDYVSGTTGRINVLVHKDAIHFATSKLPRQQGLVRFQSNYIPEYLSTVSTADILFGVIENRGTYGVIHYTTAS